MWARKCWSLPMATMRKARALAERLGREILALGAGRRHARAITSPRRRSQRRWLARGPVVLADRWDNPGGGVAGDSTVMVEALLRHPEGPGGDRRAVGPGRGQPSAERPARERDLPALRRQGRRNLRAARRCGGARARHDGRSAGPVRAELGFARPRGGDHDRRARRRACLHARPDIQSARSSRISASISREEDRRGEILEPFPCGFRADRREHVLSRHRRALPSDASKIPYTKARRPLAPLDPNPWL